MLYLSRFEFPSEDREWAFFMGEKRTCYDSFYPFHVLAPKGVKELTPDALRRTAGFVLKNNDDIDHFLAQPDQGHSHNCTCGGNCGGHHHG